MPTECKAEKQTKTASKSQEQSHLEYCAGKAVSICDCGVVPMTLAQRCAKGSLKAEKQSERRKGLDCACAEPVE